MMLRRKITNALKRESISQRQFAMPKNLSLGGQDFGFNERVILLIDDIIQQKTGVKHDPSN